MVEYVSLVLPSKEELLNWRTWLRCWEVVVPKYKNWSRFYLMTPLFVFTVNGWLFWGKRPGATITLTTSAAEILARLREKHAPHTDAEIITAALEVYEQHVVVLK